MSRHTVPASLLPTLLCAALALLLLPAAAGAGGGGSATYDLPEDVVVVKSRPEVGFEPGQTITLSLRDADLVEVLRSFAVMGDFDLVVDPSVEGTVTVELDEVEWEKALAVILRTHGLSAEVDGKLWSVRERPGQ